MGDLAKDIAQEPTRARARSIFLAHPKVIKELPDFIKRQLGLPPFEQEYKAEHRGATLTQKALRWISGETEVAIPAYGTGGTPAEADVPTGSILGRLTGSEAGPSVMPRIGATRLRDRPLIKEAIERRKRTMEGKEKEKKKRGRALRLPKKLQRS